MVYYLLQFLLTHGSLFIYQLATAGAAGAVSQVSPLTFEAALSSPPQPSAAGAEAALDFLLLADLCEDAGCLLFQAATFPVALMLLALLEDFTSSS